MTIGSVAVGVVPDATNFWRDFRARTAGDADRAGRDARREFDRGFSGARTPPIRLRADVDTTRARAEIKSLQREGSQSAGGLLQAILPLAPALAPLAGAAGAAGAALGATFASSILAVLGFKNAMTEASDVGARTATSVSAVKDALSGLEATAAHAALPGLEQSVATITSQLPRLRSIVAGQAQIAGEVVAHLTRGLVSGFENFGPVITMVSRDIDTLAAHFESWATGPGGARFARTLATDYEKVRPTIIAVEHAVVDLLQAGMGSGLGIVSLLGDLARAIDAVPRPALTAIIDGLLAFKAVGLLMGETSIVATFTRLRTAAAATSASIRLSSLEAVAARDAEAAGIAAAAATEAEADVTRAQAARSAALQVILAQEGVQEVYSANAEALLAASAEEIAAYRAVAQAATLAAEQQALAAEESAAAAESAGAAAGAASLGSILGPVGLAVGGLLLLTTAFGDDGHAAQEAASQIDGYTSALINSKGAIDSSVRTQAASALQQQGLIASAKQYGITQGQLTDAVLNGGAALDSVNAVLDAHTTKTSKAFGNLDELTGAYSRNSQGASVLKDAVADQALRFQTAASAAANERAAIDGVNPAIRQQATALHSTTTAYIAAKDATAGSVEKTREQTVAFQLANDAASLLTQALATLAGQNLGVAQAETSFQQSIHTTIDALKHNRDIIRGNSTAALANQQAIQSSVSSARQYADAVAKQTGSTHKAIDAYRGSRNALLDQLRAQGQLTPAVQAYINKLFDVKGVSDYLTRHPTKHDVQIRAAEAAAKVRALQADIDSIHQRRTIGVGISATAAAIQIQHLQAMIDRIHGKTVSVSIVGDALGLAPNQSLYGLAGGGTAPEGLFWTGERGAELVRKRGSEVDVYSHGQSMAMASAMGLQVPGFASGTAGTAQQIAAALSKAFGFGRMQNAGVLGNLMVESGLNPRAYNARENAHGFAQWEGPRWTALQNYAARMGMSATSTRAEIGFLVKELRGSGLVPAIRRMSDPSHVAALFDAKFERSAGTSRGAREAYAREFARSLPKGAAGKAPKRRATAPRAPRSAASSAAAAAAAAKAASAHVANAIAGIGAAPGAARFDINQSGYAGVAAQILRAQKALSSAKLPAATVKRYEAEITHFARALRTQLSDLRVKVRSSDLTALRHAIGGTADQVRASFSGLLTDMKHANFSAAQIARIRGREGLVVAANNRYTAARDYTSSIRGTLAGTFDPTKYGSAQDLISGLRGQTDQNNSYAHELNSLRSRTKGNKTLTAFINQLAAQGQTATLESLAGSSKADLANVTKGLSAYNTSLSTGADAASREQYGKTAAQFHADVMLMVKHTDKMVIDMVRGVVHILAKSHTTTAAQTQRELAAFVNSLSADLDHGRAVG